MSPSPRPLHVVLAACASFLLAGLAIARLTLSLNDHFAGAAADVFLLLLYFAAFYSLIGCLLGSLAGGLLALTRRLLPRMAPSFGVLLIAGFGLGPLLYLLLLPDTGLGSRVLGDLLTATPGRRLATAAWLGLILTVAGLAGLAVARLARHRGWHSGRWLAVAWSLAFLLLVGGAFTAGPPAVSEPPADVQEAASAPDPPPPRVILLVIDGADLQVIQPMISAGELPHFARLLEEGTWGPLATYEPTLSPLVWTTIATGKAPAEHGIRHFLHFRLPGIERPIYEFPLHTGLNFRLFPLLEKIPGMPVLRAPYTSSMRRTAALWNIAERFYPVGVYRWLLSWPAEKVQGFSVAGGFGWAQFELDNQLATTDEQRTVEPPDLFRGAPGPRRLPVAPAALEPYVGPNEEIDPADPRWEAIRTSLGDPTARELAWLIGRFDPRFVAAAFFSVDGFHHLFSVDRARGSGPFAGAIAERYRFTDARLGELMAALEDQPTQLLIVSDHGFDFVHHHHTYAPPGLFIAHGPAFAAGRRVDGLTVYDIAPLVLHLLGLALPDDMPGAVSGNYRASLGEEFLARFEVGRIATWEPANNDAPVESGENPETEEIRKTLEALGYIE